MPDPRKSTGLIKGEIETRRISLENPGLRPALCKASAKLPGKLLHEVNEVRVLHGTKPSNVLAIIKHRHRPKHKRHDSASRLQAWDMVA